MRSEEMRMTFNYSINLKNSLTEKVGMEASKATRTDKQNGY